MSGFLEQAVEGGASYVTMGGDISGNSNNATVANIQGNPVNSTAPTAAQVLIENAGATGSKWNTISQDVTLGSTGIATVNSVSATSGFTIASSITQKTILFNDGYSGATTTDNGTYTIYTGNAIAASSCQDYVVTVVGHDATDGYMYRADFSFSYQRIATASPTSVGASPVPLNVRTSTGASGWGGASISLSGDSPIVQVQGATGKTINWVVAFNAITCT
jgi:hypothetical protein